MSPNICLCFLLLSILISYADLRWVVDGNTRAGSVFYLTYDLDSFAGVILALEKLQVGSINYT